MVGYYDEDPVINPQEVASFKWMSLEDVKDGISNKPELYSEWFKIIFNEYDESLI
jgi:isopentenyl-diphosphate delta-isomerase